MRNPEDLIIFVLRMGEFVLLLKPLLLPMRIRLLENSSLDGLCTRTRLKNRTICLNRNEMSIHFSKVNSKKKNRQKFSKKFSHVCPLISPEMCEVPTRVSVNGGGMARSLTRDSPHLSIKKQKTAVAF